MIGFHASHEQFPPSRLLELAIRAEKAGFQGIVSSDHFYPWSKSQAQSGFAWSWIGAAMQATSLPFGIVTTPGYRYHPAVIAQAAATLSEMFPERFWLALGSGELLNEGITGGPWPTKAVRNQRLKESSDIIQKLLVGEQVTHQGSITVEDARLFTRPKQAPIIMASALTSETARWLGSWANGLVTVGTPKQVKATIHAFREGGGGGKPIYVKVEVSYASQYDLALEGAEKQWKYIALGSSASALLRLPEMFDEASKFIRPTDITDQVCVSPKAEEHIERLQIYLKMGIDRLYVHNVNLEQEEFLDFYQRKVLPSLKL